jgi:hypothetical protein
MTDKLEQAETLLIQLHQIVCQLPDLTETELEQTNDLVKELNQGVCSCYALLSDYLVEEVADV